MDLKISTYSDKIPFKSAQMNIVSIADNHGDLLSMPQLMKAIELNKKDIFEKSSEKSTSNVFAIAGDYFMNPLKTGFWTNPDFNNGDVQYNFLSKLLYTAKSSAGFNNFETVYTPGNHCYDGGDEWLYKKLRRAPMTTILSNVDKSESPLAKQLIQECRNVVTEKIIEIPDSKKKNQTNKVLILGVTIPSMDYYHPKLIHGTKFYDNSSKNDASLQRKDLVKTLNKIKKNVEKFKNENPDGAVILMSHTGNKISNMIADKVPDINLILNGHDHKEFEVMHGNTLILSHGQNNKFFRSTALKFNDKGKLEEIRSKKIETDKYDQIARKDKNLQGFLSVNIGKDLEPIVKFKISDGAPEEMVLDDSIRYSNSILANYITSAVKRPLRELYPDVDAIGIPTGTFRGGLKSNERRHTLNNLDVMKIFDGSSEDLSVVKVGKITGKELTDLITENISNNLKSKTRNPIIQWSDIQVNRTMFKEAAKNGQIEEVVFDAIKIRNPKTRRFEKVKPDRIYTIALPDKYLTKDSASIKVPSQIKDKFESSGQTLDSLFRKYLEIIDYKVKITDKTREKRIL